jgi:hypothetical protein
MQNANYNPNEDAPPAYPQTPSTFAGYQNIGFVPVYPNTNETVQFDPAAPRANFQNVPHLSEDEAREALAKYVQKHCCYGTGPVKNLQFQNLESTNVYRYILQSYTESRTTSYVSTPYQGQVITNTGVPPPQPWDIPVPPSVLFNNEVRNVEIPNTAHVENCTTCNGVGTKMCWHCSGRGTKQCFVCSGSGRTMRMVTDSPHHEHHNHHDHHHDPHGGHHTHDHHHHHGGAHHESQPCGHCIGTGFVICETCQRTGRVTCNTCRGSGKLKWFLQLTVTFTNNVDDFLKNTSSYTPPNGKEAERIPDDMIRDCLAQNTFSEQNVRVFPISHHDDADVNRASERLINDHNAKFATVRLIAQRQDVNIIPVTVCNYTYKNKPHTFHVYGLDHQVYAPSYPNKFLCCSII